jgi:hypothetical protein
MVSRISELHRQRLSGGMTHPMLLLEIISGTKTVIPPGLNINGLGKEL